MGNYILIIHNYLWSHYKGIVFSRLNKITLDNNKCLKVIHLSNSEQKRAGMGHPDFKIHQYAYEVLFPSKSLNNVGFFEKFVKLFFRIFRNKPRIINIPGYNDLAIIIIMIIARIIRIKIIMSVDSTKYDSKRIWYKELPKHLLLKVPNAFLCYGQMQKEYLESLGVKSNKIFFRCQATDNIRIINEYNNHSCDKKENDLNEKKSLLFVGRIDDKEKNIFRMVDAFNAIENKNNWKLNIVGFGKDVLILKNKITDCADIDYFEGGDWLEIVKWYSSSDALILPSLSEPWGLVVNEAMLCHLPVLVSKNCGCSLDLVRDSLNGYLFDPLNTLDIQNAIINIISKSDDDRKKMGESSYKIVEAYTSERSAKEMFDVFNKFLN